MTMGMGHMGISYKDFWDLTLTEFWCIYYAKFGKPKPQMTLADLDAWEKKIPN